jgi:hypothetical protein
VSTQLYIIRVFPEECQEGWAVRPKTVESTHIKLGIPAAAKSAAAEAMQAIL